MFSDEFVISVKFSDLDAMWDIVHKIMVLSASKVFKRKWFKGFDYVFTKESSRFHKLELLVSKIVKISHEECVVNFESLMGHWISLDNDKASFVQDVVDSGAGADGVHSALFSARRFYHASKLAESLRAKEADIKSAIDKRIESFDMDKGHIIRSMLEQPFHKVVLDYLVISNELVFEPDLVKSKVDNIMKGWTRKRVVVDNTFSGVMCAIDFDELHHVVSNLPNGKAAGLSVSFGFPSGPVEFLSAWVSMIPKPYEWESVLINTCPIALIKTACKILFKILSDRISLACSSHDVLCGDNFSVLKGMMVQSPIFAIEHLEKSLVRIKMCSKFIRFFGSIHKNCTNHVMTDFGLTEGYHVHDGLDQEEHQKSVYRYRLNSHFVSKSGCTKSQARLSSFFAAGAFHIFNVASEFFQINNISINNDKTVAIPINGRYLDIFLSTEGLSKPNLAKVNSDVHFFTNLVLRKVFSFVPVGMCTKWDALIRKDLKLKSGLPLDFPSNMIHHPSFYGLKSFLQCQSECKVASLVSFANSSRILGRLFSHRSHDLQVLCWWPIHLLISSTHIHVSISNNFLADVVSILLDYRLSLGGFLASVFWFRGGIPMSIVLGDSLFFKFLPSLWHYGVVFMDQLQDCHGDVFSWLIFKWWKRLDPCGPVPEWFKHSVKFLVTFHSSPLVSVGVGSVDICGSDDFVFVCDYLSWISADSLSVYTDGLLKNLGMTGCRAGTAVFFEDVNLGLGISVRGLVSSTLAELQAIALVLKCVPAAHSVCLFSDSQVALDACMSEINLVYPDFCNQYWVECQHIKNVIRSKNLRVSWHKIKDYFGVLGNNRADSIADAATLSDWFLPPCVDEHFLLVDDSIISGNSRHFVRDVFYAICWTHWEVGSSSGFLPGDLHLDVDWPGFSRVWHPDSHMATGFTSRHIANTYTYFMKALYYWLPMAVQKCIYDRCYPSVLCLYCGEVKVSDHVFSCVIDDSACHWIQEAVSIFHNSKVASIKIADFVHSLCVAFRNDIWLVHAKYCAYMEKNGLIPVDGSISILVSGLVSRFSDGVVKLLGIAEAFDVRFGFRKICFFSQKVHDLHLV
ncbi:hypothetical protein G9A89_014759 [Geosiphon pyriformis]|nr:hypothetical protein G9A89_014759 [Geosiphon pyriformis]